MFIKVTRSAAITALQQGRTVFFGASGHPELANGFQLGKLDVSRRKAASWPNSFRWICSKGTKFSWWVHE